MRTEFRKACTWLVVLILIALMAVPAAASEMWGAVTVKTYAELVQAVNEDEATDITLSRKYKHGVKELRTNLIISEGREVVISAPEDADTPYVLEGTLDVYGENGGGHLILENIDIVGSDEMPALWAGGSGLTVTAGNLTGGKSTKYTGGTGLEAGGDAVVEAGIVTGGDTRGNAAGGDAVVASGNAKVTVQKTVAGSAAKGYGGSAVAAAQQANVTVTGDAVAGNGLLTAGIPVVQGTEARVNVKGKVLEGEKLPDKREHQVPEQADSLAALRYMLRRGDRDITLSKRFSANESQTENVTAPALFALDTWQVAIHGSEEKKSSITCGLRVLGGNFLFDGVSLSSKKGLTVSGGHVIWNGDISCSGKNNPAVTVLNDAVYEQTGKIKALGEDAGLYAGGSAKVWLNGSVVSQKSNALVAYDQAGVILSGQASGGQVKKDVAMYPVLFAEDNARITVNGSVSTRAQGAYAGGQAVIRVLGDLESANKNYYCIWTGDEGKVSVSGKITGLYLRNDQELLEKTEPAVTATLEPTATPVPTATPTPVPTDTPAPTDTPVPADAPDQPDVTEPAESPKAEG